MPLSKPSLVAALSFALCSGATGARADDAFWSWFSGEWSLTLGAAGMVAPEFEGADSYALSASPIISLGRKGSLTRFSSSSAQTSKR